MLTRVIYSIWVISALHSTVTSQLSSQHSSPLYLGVKYLICSYRNSSLRMETMLNFLFRSVLNAPQVSSSLNILQIRGVVCLVLIEMPLTSNSSQIFKRYQFVDFLNNFWRGRMGPIETRSPNALQFKTRRL